MKRAILKIDTSGKIEVFTSLRKLFDTHTEIEEFEENIVTHLTRKKIDYDLQEGYILRRVNVNIPKQD